MRRSMTGLLLIIIGALFLLQALGLAHGISFGAAALLLVGLSIAGSGLRRSCEASEANRRCCSTSPSSRSRVRLTVSA
ncbi:MAG: hypothetical protein LOD90_08425, partial [Symbiobacteriaceae bacterium]